MAADALAPCVARSSASMVLTAYELEQVLVWKVFKDIHHPSVKKMKKL